MKIFVLGAGTWGVALARLLSINGHLVTIWSPFKDELSALSNTHRHKNLPNMVLPENITFSDDLSLISQCEIAVFAVPSVFVRDTAKNVKRFLNKNTIVVDVAKGIEKDTCLTLSQVLQSELGSQNPVVALSGPTHAEEVSLDLPTTIVSASKDHEAAKTVQNAFNNNAFRVYTNDDIIGVEVGGALKNIIALASGIATGLGFGDNTKAALITRGIAEIKRLGIRMGGNERTFAGLAGIGDLVVTCTSEHSRNNRAGRLIGQGLSAKEAQEKVGMVVEGINCLEAAMELSKKYSIELPIIHTVYDIVYNGLSPKDAVGQLMSREARHENDDMII